MSGVLRTTFSARSRVRGEAAALELLAELGLQPRLALAVGEARRYGFLVDSFLYLRELNATPLDRWLADARDHDARREAFAALGRFVARWHGAEIVDRDLHLRNFLRTADGALAKIDSPFARRVRAPWRAVLQRRERARLESEIATIGTADELTAFTTAAAAPSCRG